MFEGIQFSVLGLGDTNYDKYCYMGKSIDKRLGELGGVRALDLHCADEGTGLEETVEAWKTLIFGVAKSQFGPFNNETVVCKVDGLSISDA